MMDNRQRLKVLTAAIFNQCQELVVVISNMILCEGEAVGLSYSIYQLELMGLVINELSLLAFFLAS